MPSSRISRRALLAITAGAAVGGRAGEAHAAIPLRIGMLHTLSPAPLYIAQARGYFAREGLAPKFRFFEAAQPIAAAAVSGDIDIGSTALTGGFFNLAARGALRVFGGMLHEEPGYDGSAILVSRKAYAAGLTSPAKLAGHSFGITQYGSSFHYMVGRLAMAAHFPLKSIVLRPLQTVPNMVAAVRTGQVDATIAIASMAKPLDAKGEAKIIGWVGDLVPYQITTLFTTERMIRKKADTLHRFARAYESAIADYFHAFLRKDAAGKLIYDASTTAAIAAIQKYVFVGDPKGPEKILAGLGYYSPGGGLDVADVGRQLHWFEAQGFVKAHLHAAQVVDTSFIKPMQGA